MQGSNPDASSPIRHYGAPMLSSQGARWGAVRATIIRRPAVVDVEQRYLLPWHTFRLAMVGRHGPGSTTAIGDGRPVPFPTSTEGVSFYPAGVELRNQITRTTAMTYMTVYVDPGLAAALHDDGPPRFVASTDLDSTVGQAILRGMRDDVMAGRRVSRLHAETAALLLLLEGAKASAEGGAGAPKVLRRGGLSPRQVSRVKGFLVEHLARDVPLAELAALVDLSAPHFCRAFRVATGLPPHRWQTRARIERSRELLLHSDLAIAEVAAAVGFCDQAHFTTTFRRSVGTPPHAWRRVARG